VPNPWFGILPWGAEGILIVVVTIAVIAVVIAAIVYLIVKIIKLGIFFKEEYSEKETERSSLSHSFLNHEHLNRITCNVLDAIDKYSEIKKG